MHIRKEINRVRSAVCYTWESQQEGKRKKIVEWEEKGPKSKFDCNLIFFFFFFHLSIFISLSLSFYFVNSSSQRPLLCGFLDVPATPHFIRISVDHSVIFNVDPDTHIDSIEQAELAVLEGTANWSAKIAVTGT